MALGDCYSNRLHGFVTMEGQKYEFVIDVPSVTVWQIRPAGTDWRGFVPSDQLLNECRQVAADILESLAVTAREQAEASDRAFLAAEAEADRIVSSR